MPRQAGVTGAATYTVNSYPVACSPPFWARGGHAQTVLSHLLPSRGKLLTRANTRHREIDLEDGDRLLVFELPSERGARVIMMHGLSGDVNSEYLRRSAHLLHEQGFDVWAVNHRGCGEGAGIASRPYHSGRTEDLAAVLAASRRDAPDRVQVVVGFSLSGNLALLHAGRDEGPKPDGILAVNPPIDLERATIEMGRGLSRLYEVRFLLRLKRDVERRQRLGLLDRSYSITPFMSMLAFDDTLTAPECGFDSGLDYYHVCSSGRHLENIRTRSVILSAEDDPFVPGDMLRSFPRSDSVQLHIESTGGHVGYLTSAGPGLGRWLDGAVLHYVEQLASAGCVTTKP